jgi:hypothetical protein
VRLGAAIPLWRLNPGTGVLTPTLVAIVAPQDGGLRALLVDKDEVDHDAGAIRPFEPGWCTPIPDQVATTDPLGYGVLVRARRHGQR